MASDKPVRKPRRRIRIRITAAAWVYIGVVVAMGGIGLIAYAWARVAGLINVALQIPYLISGALIGLAVTAIGIAIAHFSSQHRDATERMRELQRLGDVLESIATELRESLDETEDRE